MYEQPETLAIKRKAGEVEKQIKYLSTTLFAAVPVFVSLICQE